MRRVYRCNLIWITKGMKPKFKQWKLLFTCYDASDIDVKLKELWLSRIDVMIKKPF